MPLPEGVDHDEIWVFFLEQTVKSYLGEQTFDDLVEMFNTLITMPSEEVSKLRNDADARIALVAAIFGEDAK